MTVKGDTAAFLNARQAYWAASERGENDGSSQSKPQDRDVAWEGAGLCAKSLAALFDYQKSGVLRDIDAGPSMEARLVVAALMHRQQEKDGI